MLAAGIAFAVAAAVSNAFAIVLQASEARQAPAAQAGRPGLIAGLIRRPRWLAGTGLQVLSWPLQVLALSFAPITVVQPMLATSQLVLLGAARVELGERVGRREVAAVIAIVVGVAAVVWAAPRHTLSDASPGRLAQPMVAVGALGIGAYVLALARPHMRLPIVLGAGLAYAWVDFADKLLSNDISLGHWTFAAIWLVVIVAVGALALLEENTALTRQPAINVGPVVGAVQQPLPVLMALWAGVEVWGAGAHHVGPLIGGLALVVVGAATLGRAGGVARLQDVAAH
jgi:drug/metabolite transporter (DMT)-like permease